MARPERNTIDYFPHYISDGKKIFFIEHKYKNDGYATWFKLLEMLGATEYHFLNLNNESDLMYVSAKCRVSEETLISIINDLCKLGEFNKIAWQSNILWSDKFIKSIQDAYSRRNNKCMTFEGLCKHLISYGITLIQEIDEKPDSNTQSIVEDIIVEEIIVEDTKRKPVFNFKKSLLKLGAEEKHIDDWLKVRKLKKASNTETALDGFVNECNKHSYEINDAVKICAEKSWAGFKHDWLENDKVGVSGIPSTPDLKWINNQGKDIQLYQQASKKWRDNGFEFTQPEGSTRRVWRAKQ